MGNKTIGITLGALIMLLTIMVGVHKAKEYIDNEGTVNYTAQATSTEAVTMKWVKPEDTDKINEAQRQLDEAKKLLDEEETSLLAEIEDINAKAEADVAQRESRLEKIRETRMSFSQAPDQVE